MLILATLEKQSPADCPILCAQDAKRDRRRQKILEAAEYWAAKREDPYVDEFYKAQVARDEAYANRLEFVVKKRCLFFVS